MADLDLASHRVPTPARCRGSAYYVPNFIDDLEAADLLKHVYGVPRPKWTTLRNRRLQTWGGSLLSNNKGLLVEPLPLWLASLTARVSALGVYEGRAANHVLVNEYLPGQGIMPHTDGAAYAPHIATVSLGGPVLLDFYEPVAADESLVASDTSGCRPFFSLHLEPNSLVVIEDDLFDCVCAIRVVTVRTKTAPGSRYACLHGIAERVDDTITAQVGNIATLVPPLHPGDVVARTPRVSLTIRNVPVTRAMPVIALARK